MAGLASDEGGSLPVARELSGTWYGSYSQLVMAYYEDDADCTLRFTDSATFTAKCTRSRLGTNNLAKASSWSGRIVTKGNGVVLEDQDGKWPWIDLKQSRNGNLYGVTVDPRVGATIEMDFAHAPKGTAAAGD